MIKLHKNIVLLSLLVNSAHAAQQPTTYPLHEAVKNNQIDVVRQLVNDQRSDINLKDQCGCTALMYAAYKGDKEMVKLLLTFPGINANVQDNSDHTALILAAAKGHKEVVQALLEDEEIDVNLRDRNGNTALIYAADKGHTEIVQVLLELNKYQKKVNVNQINNNHQTALICAAALGYTEIVQALLGIEEIEVNLQDINGNTALIYGAMNGHGQTVRTLLFHKPNNVNLENKEKKNALSYLKNKNSTPDTLTYLVKNTETPSIKEDHDLLKKDYLEYLYLFKLIYKGKCNQDLRQYIDILLVNKMLNYIKEDQRPTFYQACCDAYKPWDLNIIIQRSLSDYLKSTNLYSLGELEFLKTHISPIITEYICNPKEDTYAGFLQIVHHTQHRFLFEVIYLARWGGIPKHEAVATQNLASALAKHGIVQDAKEISNEPLDVIIPLLFACMKKMNLYSI